MSSPRQLEFFKKPALEYGGGLERGRRKTFRPFDSKRPVHVVMRAGRARGAWSLLRPANRKAVDGIVRVYAKRFRVRVMEFQNVGNHLHLLVQASKREDFRSFMRTIPAQIATRVTGARRGKALKPIPAGDGEMGISCGRLPQGARGAKGKTSENRSAAEEKRRFWDGLVYSRVVHWGRDLLGLRHYLTKNAFEGDGIELLTASGVTKRFYIRNGRLIV
ncbi:MAG: hypothetical protein HYW49_12465 [Deltaproteobacteria bacterium]|nr:hypothetical protein [Deltaproteobacteria bacterium]